MFENSLDCEKRVGSESNCEEEKKRREGGGGPQLMTASPAFNAHWFSPWDMSQC
jgi:hypothetical protein